MLQARFKIFSSHRCCKYRKSYRGLRLTAYRTQRRSLNCLQLQILIRNQFYKTTTIQAFSRGGGTPLYGLYRYVRPQRVWFFSRFGHKQGIDFSHFAAILIMNRVSIFLPSSLQFVQFFLEEATSSSRPPSPIHALSYSTQFNACYAGQIKPATKALPLMI